jgi:hypothetical protein
VLFRSGILFAGIVLWWIGAGYAQHRLIGRPDTAVKLAAQDAKALAAVDPVQAANSWYIWMRDPTDKDFETIYDFVLNNAVSRAPILLRADRVRSEQVLLLRIDKRRWLPEPEDRERFDRIVNGYFDPNFYVQGADTIGGVAEVVENVDEETQIRQLFAEQYPKLVFKEVKSKNDKNQVMVATEPYTQDGKDYTAAYVVLPPANAAVAAGTLFGPAVQATAGKDAQDLCAITGMQIPIVEAERWMVFSLRTLDGGLYYKLQGLDDGKGKRLTQDEWLSGFGADEKRSIELGGRELIGLWASNVTGKPRRAQFMFGTNMRPSSGQPLIVITQDNLDETKDVAIHPMYSLLDNRYDATEILATRPNGLISYALFDGKGALQDAAPDNLVRDHTVPRPFTSRLEPAISCIRCHGPHDQWQPMPNQVKTLLEAQPGGFQLSVVGDLAAPHVDTVSLNLELARLYSGDLTLPLELARNSYEAACARLTGVVRETPDHAKWTVSVLSDRVDRYLYRLVTPQEALRTLGVYCETEEAAVKMFNTVIPAAVENSGPKLTDVAIASLRLYSRDNTLTILRSDWERIYQSALAYSMSYGSLPIPEAVEDVK